MRICSARCRQGASVAGGPDERGVHLGQGQVDVGLPGPRLQEAARGGCCCRGGDDGELLVLVCLFADEREAPRVDFGGRGGHREGAVLFCSCCCCCCSFVVAAAAGAGAERF